MKVEQLKKRLGRQAALGMNHSSAAVMALTSTALLLIAVGFQKLANVMVGIERYLAMQDKSKEKERAKVCSISS